VEGASSILWVKSEDVTQDEVVPGLWQGDWPYPSDLSMFDIVISATAEGRPPVPSLRPGAWHIHVPIHDHEMDQPDLVRDVARQVSMVHAEGRNVLVHCAQGLNRSGVIVARALMFEGWPVEDAIRVVRQARGAYALSNPWFVAWLQQEAVSPVSKMEVWGGA
jgi:protein-tyrosine phosphatase